MRFEARRAIEALRAGVPNADAVKYLGSGQPAIMERFRKDLSELESPPSLLPPAGFVIEGGFGSGKSHLLRFLKEEALKHNFAASLVVISKETPLSDLDAVYKAAVKGLALPDRQGGDLNEVALKLDSRSARYGDFFRSVMAADGALDPLFAATLRLFQDLSSNDELSDTIQSFWAGSRINVSVLRKELRQLREWGIEIKPRKNAELAPQRFLFASKLMRAAGYRGWILLLDEVELVASFGLRSRAKSYANLSWFLGRDGSGSAEVFTVAAVTDEFKGTIIDQKQDNVKIPLKLAEKDPRLAAQATSALQLITDTPEAWEVLLPLTDADLDRVHKEVRELYREAFDWESRDPNRAPYQGVGRSMRMHMREWITRWDLERLDPAYTADIESEKLRPDLTEREGMEGFSEDESEEMQVTSV
jgi:hypothetical protein